MYLWTGRRNSGRKKKGSRLRGKLKAKNRRRTNRMHGRPLGRKIKKTS